MSAEDDGRQERFTAAWEAVLDAHDRLIEMLAEDVEATAATMQRQERADWRRWLARSRAEMADMRADGPPHLWGKP
ncbi:MAG: hypothetical protein WCR51_04360 [Planctomycetia bacterium]